MISQSLDDILAVVDTWFAEEAQSPPVSHHTECYNQMYAARASLRDRLAVALTGEPLTPLAPPSEDVEAGEPNGEGPVEPEKVSQTASEGSEAPTKAKQK